jgi:two-component system CheB/CheR fusion protein
MQDCPFPEVDLLVCRNVLMYFTPEARMSVLKGFHAALENSGFLFLGNAEMLPIGGQIFKPFCSHHNVYSSTIKKEVNKCISIADQRRLREPEPCFGTV